MQSSDYLAPIQLSDNCWVLGGPFAWVYLVDGARPILLDSGMTFMVDGLTQQLKSILQGRQLWGILHTHSHFDHLGCTSQLVAEFGVAMVGAHERVGQILERPGAVATMAALNDPFCQGMNVQHRFKAPINMQPVKHGDCIEVSPDVTIDVIGTPGHTRDSISFIVKPDALAVVGEAAGVPIQGLDHIQVEFLTSHSDYRESIIALQQLGLENLGLPHKQYALGADVVRTYLDDSLTATDIYIERLRQYWRRHNDADKVFEQVFAEDFSGGDIGQPEPAYRLNLQAQVALIGREFKD